MVVDEQIASTTDSSSGLGAAVGNMEASVREFSECLLARVSNDAAELGRGPQVLAAAQKMINNLLSIKADLAAGRMSGDPMLENFAGHLTRWISKCDLALDYMDQIELQYSSYSREQRRAKARRYAVTSEVANKVRKIKEHLLELYEMIDPTPDHYFDELVQSIHGDQAQSMIASFSTLSSSDNYSLDAFKRRHSLK